MNGFELARAMYAERPPAAEVRRPPRKTERQRRQEAVLRAQQPRAIPKKKRNPWPTTLALQDARWAEVRKFVFARDGRACARCSTEKELQIDHILPKSKRPDLIFEPSNLQVLCRSCNFRKRREEEQ